MKNTSLNTNSFPNFLMEITLFCIHGIIRYYVKPQKSTFFSCLLADRFIIIIVIIIIINYYLLNLTCSVLFCLSVLLFSLRYVRANVEFDHGTKVNFSPDTR